MIISMSQGSTLKQRGSWQDKSYLLDNVRGESSAVRETSVATRDVSGPTLSRHLDGFQELRVVDDVQWNGVPPKAMSPLVVHHIDCRPTEGRGSNGLLRGLLLCNGATFQACSRLLLLLLFELQSSLGTKSGCLQDLSMPLHPAVLIVIKVLRIARLHLPWFYCGIKVRRPDGQRPPTVRKEAKVAELSFTVLFLAVSLIDGAPLKFFFSSPPTGAWY